MSNYGRRLNRRATTALPGYDNLGWDSFGHPASSAQTEVDAYGFDAEFGEGVRKGPYRSGPAPASYGWTPDHPATKDSLVEDYAMTEDLRKENLKLAMERKAAKCIRIAESRLGKNASQAEIEELALRFMDLPNHTINSRVASLSRNADNVVQVNTGYDQGLDFTGPFNAEDELVADDLEADDLEADDLEADDLEADEMMGHTLRDEYDFDMDGMISSEEWGGSSSVFEAMDSDMDGMLDADDISMGVGESFAEEAEAFMASRTASKRRPSARRASETTAADLLAEELAMLKAANARLARQVRKMADNATQQNTGYTVEDFSNQIDTHPDQEEVAGEPTPRLASRPRLNRLANALAEYMADQNSPTAFYSKGEKASAKKADFMADEMAELMAELEASDEAMGEDVMGLDVSEAQATAMDPKLARIFQAAEEETEEEAEEESEEEAEEESEEPDDDVKMTDDEEEEEEEAKEEKKPEAKKPEAKKAAYRPKAPSRQASVKTLGNISREASASDELSKLWETAPDVSKFFS